MLFGGGKRSKKDENYPGYVIHQDYNKPKATVTAGSYQGTVTLPDGIIPLGVRLTWTYASLNHGHGLSLNDKGVIYLEGPGNKSFDITVDIEGKYGWDWLKSQSKFTFANSDPYAMATTIRVVRWAEKNSGGGALIRTSNYLKTLLLSLISQFATVLKHDGKEVSNMLFGGSKGKGKSTYPGYELKTGVLCSLPQANQSNMARRSLTIPAGCIPVSIKCTGTWNCYSGKGETSSLGMSISDNNGKSYISAHKNSGPQWMSLNAPFYLDPLGAYDNDVEAASTINRIDINTWGNGGMYDATTGKVEVTAWLEKTGAGGAKPVKPKEYKRLYLYKDGDQCTDVTGGWAFTKPAGTASGYSSSLNKEGEMYCGGQNSGNATFGTVNSINMSDYDRMIVEFHFDGNAGDGNASFYINFESSNMLKINIATAAKNKICLAGTSEMIGGKVNLVVATGGYSTTHMYIKRVWLETVGE